MSDIDSNLPVKDTSDGTPGSAVPAFAEQIGGSDGTNLRTISVDTTGKININNISGTVSLPTGAATSALQTTGNSSLSSIDSKLNTLGQKTMANSVPIAIASDQSAIPVSQSGTWTVQQGATPTVVANAWPIKLTDGTNTTAVKAASTAALATDPSAVVALSPNSPVPAGTHVIGQIVAAPGTKATYSASVLNLVSAATATDIFTISGSATTTVRVLRIGFSIDGGQQQHVASQLIKRSSANTGGTSTTHTAVPYDSSNAAATSVIRAYTVNPTSLGAAVGAVRTARVPENPNNIAGLNETIYDFGSDSGQAIVLRGTTQSLALNLNSTTIPSPLICVWVEWTEE